MTEQTVEIIRPDWAAGKSIDERKFCHTFGILYPMAYVDGHFYSRNGMESEQMLRKWIYDYISPYYSSGLGKKVNALMEAMKMEMHQSSLSTGETRIHCANGTFNVMDSSFSPVKDFCRCRLPVNYNADAAEPVIWKQFLAELLAPEDILTLQEFLGYCLVPVNYAQKMLLIIGKGGEGKSRIGIIARHLLGSNMVNGSLTKLEKNQFARADLQNRLLMVDDDLQMEALTTTGNIKTIVTAEQPLDLERKGVQSYQGELFCRLMAFGNGNLQSLHDRSHGFFRRQIILNTLPRPVDREDDPFLAQRMRKELEGILLWAIEGLLRLLDNNMCFTLSDGARENLRHAVAEGNNTVDFMDSQGYIRIDPQGEITSRHLYQIYKDWCDDNMLIPLSAKSFSTALIADASKYGIRYRNTIPSGNGRLVRGFRGIRSAYRV